ncbi:ABC transporter permease [Bifidobacterium imperatoris]|uniref:ABC transporter permease n=1 Tax=Bifidobacterium imperatoris TaxID=2020965 RepID=A0A2N5IS72_9BIFI|nr:ABC transporter permease [Bifidobacterium imperatoris]PLS24812.1 peptide ABC transporter permease [Bifidobacterium imperatoris]QSY57971.1 ABC transporter permease [Bifidobacterium imperatoris]
MRFGDILRLCRQNLWRRKSRTILTVLGVIVGCCSIVLMISLGQGINEQNEKMLKSMGDLSIVTVYTNGGYGGMMMGSGASSSSSSQDVKLTDESVESFRSVPGVAGVTPVMNYNYNSSARTGAGGRYLYDYVQIMGIDMSQFDQMGFKLKDGSMPIRDGEVLAGEWLAYDFMDTLKNGEMRESSRGEGCMWNNDTAQCEPYEDEDPYFKPIGTQLTLTTGANYQGDPYTQNLYGTGGGSSSAGNASESQNVTADMRITGVTVSDYNKGFATSDGIVMDLKSLKELIAKVDPSVAKQRTTNYDQVLVKAQDMASVPEVESQIKALGYETSSYEDMRKTLEEQSRAIQLILGGIGAVSLLVAAIGIANTMVMSVTERTREIGIMKALGCYVRDIRVMFLTEAGAIGFLGGLIGCIISAIFSLGINIAGMSYLGGGMSSSSGGDGSSGSIWTMLWQATVGGDDVTRYSVIPWWLYAFAILFATLIGLLFGFGPANKAVKIPALDAIKNSE